MREAPIAIPENEDHCPVCGSEHLVRTTHVDPSFWVLLAAGVLFAPFTLGASLAFPGAALLLREPVWRCEHCWRHGRVAADHTVKPAWSHLHRQ